MPPAYVFMLEGLKIMNKKFTPSSLESYTSLRLFRSLFGTSPDICAKLWTMLSPQTNKKIDYLARPKHLLWGLMLLKIYATEPVLSSLAGGCDVQTFRKWAWQFVRAIAQLEDEVVRNCHSASTKFLHVSYTTSRLCLQIVWENRFKRPTTNDCLVSVDGTDCPTQEPTPFSPVNYSYKFNGPGLRYEVALCILTGDIVWVNGPFEPGKYSDLAIFRMAS
jgi:hypothetical protein